MFSNSRTDCILIWGHGLQYLNEIMAEIRNDSGFKILKIVKHKPGSIKKLVREVYSFDYAPFSHLKSKTKYLLKTKKEVCFIFIKNLNPNEDFFGKNEFRHLESQSLKNLKETIRIKYNPRDDNGITHNHVIHATDSIEQTNQLIKYLGWDKGVSLFKNSIGFIDVPYYLDKYNVFKIKEIEIKDLYCNIVEGDTWSNFTLSSKRIHESPQYLGLTGGISIYAEYINKFRGGALQADYNLEKFVSLSKDFNYLAAPYENSYVMVELIEKKLVIVDGLHRACILLKNGFKKIKICQVQ